MISLEKLCLNKIIQEFQRFNFAFGISDDEVLKRNFKFLQRRYSFKLWSELSRKGTIKEKYFDFLLNEHLEILEEKWFKNTCYEACIKDCICRLPNLKKISLGFDHCDEILENIAKFCPKIIEINVQVFSDVSDVGIKYLSQNVNGNVSCPNLRTLCITSRRSRITEDGLLHLILNLPSLEKIDHDGVPGVLYSIHKECLTNHESLPNYNLVYLDFDSCCDLPYYTDLLKVCLNACPKLKGVSCYISDKEQLDLFNNTRLETLSLSVMKSKQKIDINNFLLRNGSNLASLSISDCIVTINVLAKSCPNLKSLEIYRCDFFYDDDDQQLIFRCLTDCTFRKETVDGTSIKAINSILSSSPRLDHLSFYLCDLSRFTEIGPLKFCENNLLKHILFYDCYVDIRIVKDILLSCSHLETLQLEACDDYELDEKKELTKFVGTLSNKPDVSVDCCYINNYDYDYEEYMDSFITYEDNDFDFI